MSDAARLAADTCTFTANGGAGIAIGPGCRAIVISSTLFGENKVAQIALSGGTPDFQSDYNVFHDGSRTAAVKIDGAEPLGLAEWQAASGNDRQSALAGEAAFARTADGDWRVRPNAKAARAGRFGRPAGAGGIAPPGTAQRNVFENIEVVSVTEASANICYFTPGRRCGTRLEWGADTAYGNVYARDIYATGEFETFHTASLIGLKPGTTYHFRVGLRDYEPATGKERWSEDRTFTTAAGPRPARTLYVAPGGDDARDGLSRATAWRTLPHASRHAAASDTVILAPGVYRGLLRPLQTGVSEDRRIVFRAEAPFTVFLDGGYVSDSLAGRSQCVQVCGKAFITLENLCCGKANRYDNGGYRGGFGYSGLIVLSGSSHIDIRRCLLDGRARIMGGIQAFDAGAAGGARAEYGFRVRDCAFVRCWRALMVKAVKPCDFSHNAVLRYMTKACVDFSESDQARVRLRNNIFSGCLYGLEREQFSIRFPTQLDSDWNCFFWDENAKWRFIVTIRAGEKEGLHTLEQWRAFSANDRHSIVANPAFPAAAKLGYGADGKETGGAFTAADFALPPESPCKGTGENGADIGPRFDGQ